MYYTVFARKWRPQFFSDVVGQKDIIDALGYILKFKKLHHAFLFSGTRGVGKTTIARLLTKGLNCSIGITNFPCGKCFNCLEISRGKFIDLIEVDAASRTTVEDIRDLLSNIQYFPTYGRFKIYLIDEVHMLSKYSFNTLLKTLEEPPDHVKFIFATTELEKIPITILSRCLQFHLKPLTISQIRMQIEKILKEENIFIDDGSSELIAKAAGGSLRDALSLTDQAVAIGQGKVLFKIVKRMLGISFYDRALEIIEAIMNLDSNKMMILIENINSFDKSCENLLGEMLLVLHRIAVVQLFPDKIKEESFSERRFLILSKLISHENLQFYYKLILIGKKNLLYSPDKKVGLEMILFRVLFFREFHIKN